MATTYSSNITVNVWKEHTCVGCGCAFRYLFKRKKTGQGGTPEAAEVNARKAVVKALENEVDLQPCPGCGLYQPDMVGSRRGRWHRYLFLAALPVFLVVFILVLADLVSYATASWVLAGTAGVLALSHLVTDAFDPNRNLEANQRLAERRVEDGDLWVPEKRRRAEGRGEEVGSGRTAAHLLCYLLLSAGAVALAAPELLRLSLGWPTNPDWTPMVAGPGDDPYIWFPEKVTSVKGYWSGNALARVTNAADVGLKQPIVQATTKTSTWPQTIRAKRSERNSSSTLWVRVHLPEQQDLAGKTLQLQLELNVSYPAPMAGQERWNELRQQFRHTATIRLADPNAGHTYKTAWWAGLVGGTLLTLVPALLLAVLANAFRRKANPTQIFVPGPPEEDEPDPQDEPPDRDEPRRGRDDRYRE
jgi:hypothetical protein